MTKKSSGIFRSSAEDLIDRRSERIIAKVAAGTASEIDRFELKQLAITRSNMMVRPQIPLSKGILRMQRKG